MTSVSTFLPSFLRFNGPSKPAALPMLPGSSAENRAIVERALARYGVLGSTNEAKARRVIDQVLTRVGGKLDRERAANGGKIDDFIGDVIVGKDRFDAAQKKTVTRRWIVGSVGFVAGMAGSGGLNIAVDQGFKWLHHFSWAANWTASLNTAFSPALFLVSGAIAGAITYLFLELTTTPLNAWFGNFAFKGSPIVSHLSAESSNTLIDAYNAANQIDGRVLTAISTMTSMLFNLDLTLGGEGGVRSLLREAKLAPNTLAKQEAIQEAASLLGGKLIWTEVAHFQFDPMFDQIFALVHAACGVGFDKMSAADAKAFEDAVIDYVSKNRPNSSDGNRPTNEQAIARYYRPFLSRLMKGAPNAKLGAA